MTSMFLSHNLVSVEKQIIAAIQSSVRIAAYTGLVPPNVDLTDLEYDGIRFSPKYNNIVIVLLLSWYTDVFQGFEGYLRYEVRSYLESQLLFPELCASCESREIILLVLENFSTKTGKTFRSFQNLLSPESVRQALKFVELKFLNRSNPRPLVRRRGYKDHGTLRPPEQWLPAFDLTFTDTQGYIEWTRKAYTRTVQEIVRVCGDWVLRRHSLKIQTKEENDDKQQQTTTSN